MKQTVVGVFDRYAAAQHAASLLKDNGIDPDCIHVTAGDEEASASASSERREDDSLLTRVKNFFAGIVDDDDQETVSTYSEAVRRGGAVVKVDVEEEPKVEVARETLVQAGAVDIEEKAQEWRQSGWSALGSTETTAVPRSGGKGRKAQAAKDIEGEQTIPVVREELEIGKRTVQAGGVRVFSHMVEEPVRQSVELREERAHVERRPVDRPASAADLDALKDRTIEVTESVERPVVQKTAKVVEEVVVGKDVRQKSATIEDKVRHTEVDVQQLGADQQASNYAQFDQDYRAHFSSRYGSEGGRYEEYEPAYQFGHALRTDQRYAGRSWDEVQTEAERDWRARHPDTPWERMKDAVRHAWERVKD